MTIDTYQDQLTTVKTGPTTTPTEVTTPKRPTYTTPNPLYLKFLKLRSDNFLLNLEIKGPMMRCSGAPVDVFRPFQQRDDIFKDSGISGGKPTDREKLQVAFLRLKDFQDSYL